MDAKTRRHRHSAMPWDLYEFCGASLGACLFEPLKRRAPREIDVEVALCEDILRRAPEHAEALAVLAAAYSKRGDHAKGLEADLRLARLRPACAFTQYNLACSYALTGRREEAFDALRRAIALGYDNLDQIQKDSDLDSLRADVRFRGMVACLKLKHETAGRA